MLRGFMSIAVLGLAAAPVVAEVKEVKAKFIGPGTYATKEGCQKLKALAAGVDRNVGTVPETLTEDGFQGWEGGCTFTSFTETEPGKRWKALMHCGEGAEEGPESDVFERLPDGKLKVTIMDSPTDFQLCDAEKGK